MSKTASNHSLAASLERIQALFSELRQTEALENQVHEMVVMKRHRLDALMTGHLELAIQGAPPLPIAAMAAPPPAAIEAPAAFPDLPLSPHGAYGAPKDLLQGRPTPSAQHVLDSLNRLMTGIKQISPKHASAA